MSWLVDWKKNHIKDALNNHNSMLKMFAYLIQPIVKYVKKMSRRYVYERKSMQIYERKLEKCPLDKFV